MMAKQGVRMGDGNRVGKCLVRRDENRDGLKCWLGLKNEGA